MKKIAANRNYRMTKKALVHEAFGQIIPDWWNPVSKCVTSKINVGLLGYADLLQVAWDNSDAISRVYNAQGTEKACDLFITLYENTLSVGNPLLEERA